MSIIIYYSSVSGSRDLKQQQSAIFQYLDSKKIKYEAVDISASNSAKEDMRRKTGNPSALPPQVFNKGVYCGDYSKFSEAVEDEKVEEFLKLK
ncbi:SH3 domain-binding glutamic acid-rich-like protein 3 [Scleropages formosus]|nr:SH3 domain-binding glutamic acid-rich-like protein 3 [Scleropages formosus]